MHRFRDHAGKAALAGVAVLLTLGVLELAVRAILAARPPGKSGEQLVYTQFDPSSAGATGPAPR